MRHTYLSFLFILIFPLTSLCQPFAIGSMDAVVTDTTRSNRQIQLRIFYPAQTAGANTTPVQGQFPLIVFGHGFAMSYTSYQNIWEKLVPEGFTLAFVDMENGLIPAPSHSNFGQDISYSGKMLQFMSQNQSPFQLYGRLNGKTAFMGHSMGGGASMLAAAFDPTFPDAVVGLAPAETNPTAIGVCSTITSPTVIYSGTKDGVTPPSTNHIPMYQNNASDCKLLVNITGGGHCYFANADLACDFGETTTGSAPTISRAEQQAIFFESVIPFLNYELKGNAGAVDSVKTALENPGITWESNCIALTGTSVGDTEKSPELKIVNPVGDYLYLSGMGEGKHRVEIYSTIGLKIRSMVLYGGEGNVDVRDLSAGVWVLRVEGMGGIRFVKM